LPGSSGARREDLTTRRQFLGGLATLAGIIGSTGTSRAFAVINGSANTSALPLTHPWRARSGEIAPSIKSVATLLLETAGAWSTSEGTIPDTRKRLTASGFNPAFADALGPLIGNGTNAVLQVRNAQYGGILNASASVLVVVDQWRRMPDGSIQVGGTTVDVRLIKATPHWRIVEVLPARPGHASVQLSPSAKRVLAESRIRLPFAAKSDVLAGGIHDSVLKMLIELSMVHLVDVSVMRSGHPLHVFGTSRISDHLIGRAVDIWALDSKPLVVPSNHALASSAMRLAVAHGAYNVGGPNLPSGQQYFSDRTHRDHIHLGFNH
jgi:hypothetical protein